MAHPAIGLHVASVHSMSESPAMLTFRHDMSCNVVSYLFSLLSRVCHCKNQLIPMRAIASQWQPLVQNSTFEYISKAFDLEAGDIINGC